MKVLTYTSLFPNSSQPLHAVFVKERVKAMAKLCDLRVVAPVPWFPALQRFEKYYTYSQVPKTETSDGLDIAHPRYVTLPKIGKSIDGWLMYRSTLRSMQHIQQEFDFDIIDAHWAYPDGYAAILLGQELGKPVSLTIRGDDISTFMDYPDRCKRIVYALDQAQGVIGVCQALCDAAVSGGAQGHNFTVIPNGVDADKFHPVSQKAARAHLKQPQERRILLSVGHLTERKGFHHVMEAVRILVQQGMHDLLYVIVGGADAEGNFRSELEKQIDAHQMHEHVLLAGAQPHAELNYWYSMADLFCLASSREGWPNVLFEALACGKPVVATRAWGIPEVICSDEYGVLVEERNGVALAHGIEAAFRREWDTEAILAYARANTWDRVGQKVINTFHKFLEKI